MAIHPGAAIFSESARKAVANGPAFAIQSEDGPFVRDDGCCLAGALIREQWPGLFNRNAVLPTINTVSALLLETGVITEPVGIPEWDILAAVSDLMDRNDEGYYGDSDTLRRDLLGILAAGAAGRGGDGEQGEAA